MEFREWLLSQEMDESRLLSNLGKGVLAGSLGIALAGSYLHRGQEVPRTDPISVGTDSPEAMELWDRLKDQGKYYAKPTEERLRKTAEEGDEWSIRELPWPEGHRYHRLGRPFFRNDKPHPQGLFPLY